MAATCALLIRMSCPRRNGGKGEGYKRKGETVPLPFASKRVGQRGFDGNGEEGDWSTGTHRGRNESKKATNRSLQNFTNDD